MRKAIILLLATTALAMAGTALVNLSGTWLLQWEGLLPDEKSPCVYQGLVNVFAALKGSASVSLQTGPDACPDEMTAEITSLVVDGTSISGVLDGGEFGMLDFQGSLVSAQQSVQAKQDAVPAGPALVGSFAVRSGGPFGGSEGSWNASLVAPLTQVPLLNPYGLFGLALLLAAASYYLYRRKGGLGAA